MIKISALNEESEEESGSEEEVTKEALEQIALQQYAKALDLQRKGNLKDATQLLKDLLDTELLYDVRKPCDGENVSGPLLNLKYLCYKNLASMLTAAKDYSGAIDALCAASDLDDTDVTLWHKLGLICLNTKRYEMALHAFQRGAECNPKHWPCLDKIVTLLLGLDYKEECISTIHEILQLDPGYLRGLAYRKHIFTVYPYIKDFMEYLNPIYKWNENDDEPFDEQEAEKLIKEAEDINQIFIEQQRAEQFKYVLPNLKMIKPITELSWFSVGESLIHMHQYMTEHCYSHACYLEPIFDKEQKEEKMEVCEEPKDLENLEDSKLNVDDKANSDEKIVDSAVEDENNDMSDKDKAATDNEKVESDMDIGQIEPATDNPSEAISDNPTELKTQKKGPVRRRGSALSFLEQWEWCNKRRSGRKKTKEQDDNIYDILRKMVPIGLSPEVIEKKENQARETSPDTTDLHKLFDEKNIKEDAKTVSNEYFGTENEQKDVKEFIKKYTENKRDIIDMLKEYLNVLAGKWRILWPKGLSKIFVAVSECYNNHIDIPTCCDNSKEEVLHYVNVNILVSQFSIDDKLQSITSEKNAHDLSIIESIGIILNLKPHIFDGIDCMELTLRYLWIKYHIHLFNKCEDLALDCLYQLLYEFEAMDDHCDMYSLNLVNFSFKPIINENKIVTSIQFLERNKKLGTVMDLYERGEYDEVLAIVIDSFEHCKNLAKNQEEEMSLDFAVQLFIILDTYWALNKVECCFKWSLVCLNEALKYYFRYTTGSAEYDKWTLTIVKILQCMDHILATVGLSCLDSVSQKEISQALENLIRIIGHQVETNSNEMPFDTIIPWIIMHYIFQREEDHGRGRTSNDKSCDDIPNPLMVLFIGHEQLGNRGWCCNSKGKLLYFILDTVVPRLHSPILAKSLEQISQYMEQCVYCLFGHPIRKNKLKYIIDHNVTPHSLDWNRAQQLYEIFKPSTLPALEGKISKLTADTEQLFHRILTHLPPELDPQKYITEMEKYIKGVEDKLPCIPTILPYKMRDIYFFLGDYYFKKDERKMAVKYNMLDIIVNSDRLESWAEISLAKTVNLGRVLNSCKNINNNREFLIPAKSIIICFKRALELDPTHCNLWIEYGIFVYTVHSFCSRLLKQASESLSMEDFESLEKQKEDMLDTTQKCFMTVLEDLNNSADSEKANEDSWLHYYMLGKVAEKKNKPPSLYLQYYLQGVKSLQETAATYPLKINYNSPTHLCIEVMELHYRIHASILKYIEQHENKPIPASTGKVFLMYIEEWKKGPYGKKNKKDGANEIESEPKPFDQVHAANIFKRSISDAGEEETNEVKRQKLESAAAKVRRSASYDTERTVQKDSTVTSNSEKTAELTKSVDIGTSEQMKSFTPEVNANIKTTTGKQVEVNKDSDTDKKEDSSSSSSTSSSSDSSSSDSTSDSSSETSRDTDNSSKSSNDSKPLTDEEVMTIISACLDALEDCASRFPQHYKAIYRLAHYHFYYKKGKDIERCRDLMLSNFMSRSGHKLGGLFSERKHSNFFNNIWKIPVDEVDRAGGFAFHMSRSVQLTMEILKEIDDHKTLLDLSLHLQRIPEPDKKYLRDSDREELAQQAFSLCVQSLKGQLTKFSQQADLKSNDVEKQALKCLTLDIYRAYQRAQKQPNSRQFTNLLVEAYKLVCTTPITDSMNLVDLSMKYCQSLMQALKQQATQASLDKSQNVQKKQSAKSADAVKPTTSGAIPVKSDPKPQIQPIPASTTGLPKMSAHEMANAFQNYLPMLNDQLSQQAVAALSYLSNISALAGYTPLQNTLQSSLQNTLQNSFQAEFYRQFLGQSLSSLGMPPQKKQKRAPRSNNVARSTSAAAAQMKPSKSFTGSLPSALKAAPTNVITSIHKSSSTPLTPSMGTVLPTLPPSMSVNLAPYGASAHASHSHSLPSQAHMSPAIKSAMMHTKPPMPHQQVSPGKTLQEKLAERQKHMPLAKSSSAQEINASISKLPSSLTITKTSVSKPQSSSQSKRPEAKKTLPFSEQRPKQINTDEVIVLDDD